MSDNKACRPRRLKIKTTRHAVNVQPFTREKQTGANLAFQCIDINLIQPTAADRRQAMNFSAKSPPVSRRQMAATGIGGGAGRSGSSFNRAPTMHARHSGTSATP